MIGRNLRLVLLVALAIVQLSVAAGAIYRSEIALRSGEVFRFRLQPVDPVDAFRGRYVNLYFIADRAPVPEGMPSLRQQKIFVPLVVDDEGFTRFGPVALQAPDEGAYLRLRSGYQYEDDDGGQVISLALPFRRYYMTEELAQEVDRSMWRRGQRPAWAEIRVRNGTGVIQDLFVDGRPIREWLADGGPESEPAPVTTTDP
jgi:uncharacterized membrane-anchored protein